LPHSVPRRWSVSRLKPLEHSGKTDIRFRPKPYGWFLLFLLIWLPLAAVVTVNNFLWIVFTMIIGVVVTSHVLAKKNLASVHFFRRFPDEIYAETLFSVCYAAKSSLKPWGSFGFTLRERGVKEGNAPLTRFPQVQGDEPTEVTAYHILDSRGDKHMGPAVISSTFPFGLAEYSRTCGSSEAVLVFPRLLPVENEIPAWLGGAGRGLERPDAFGVVPYLFRDYVPGDRYKHIDWKKTATTGSLVTMILSDEGAKEICIRLPARASERAISRAASLAVHFLRSGRPVSLEGPGLKIEPGIGKEFSRHLLTLLARWDSSAPGTAQTRGSDAVEVKIDPSGEFRWEESDEWHELNPKRVEGHQ
jgi:uncharacterized protein (DUF58 family)